MKKHVYLYAFLFCFAFFLPEKSFAANNDLSLDTNIDHRVAHFGGYAYQFYREQNVDQFVSIYRSSDGVVWNKLEQTIAEEAFYSGDEIVYKNALYVLFPYSGFGYHAQIWKTTDGTNFTNVLDDTDPLSGSAIRKVYNFFTINNKLCVIAQRYTSNDSIFGNEHLQTHCSEDGESWTVQDVTGYLKNNGDNIREVNNILHFEGKVYALVEKYHQARFVLLSSVDAVDWQVVNDDAAYFKYINSSAHLQMVRFGKRLYLFMPSKEGSGVKIFKVKKKQLIPVAYTGLTGMRGVTVIAFGSKKDSVYLYGKVMRDGEAQRCLFHSYDLHTWNQGGCFPRTSGYSAFHEKSLYRIGERLYLGDTDVTFE